MATFNNDLRLKEITTGDEDGTWGTSTNTNLELIADAFGFGTKEIPTDANATFTIPDATADGTRAFYLKITSAVSLTTTRTVTLAPNTVSKVWLIENATTGTQSITLSQGSGANVTVPKGQRALIYSDGAGAGAAIVLATPTVLLASGAVGTLPVANGGTGQSTYTNGQLLIGNTTGNTLSKATLTAGTGVTVTNGTGTITIAAVNNGTVTSVGGTGTVNGITLTGTVTSTGNLTLGGTLSNVSLTTQVTGTLPVANGGTGITSFGTGVAAFLGTPTSANLAAAVTDETGSGALVFATSPTLVTPALGTPSSGTLTNATGLPIVAGTTGTLSVARGGTDQSTYTDGQLLIGNTTGNTLAKATLTAGTGVTITNGAGAVTIAATGTGGTVTSVGGTGTVSGITLTGTVTSSGNLTLGGTLSVAASNFASQTQKTFLAAPNAANGVPTFRTILASDVPTLNQNTTGSAATLTTARTIGGVSFNGSANINLPGVNQAGNQNTTGTAANVTGTVAVANGGTGQTTYTNGQLLIGNSTGNTLAKATLTAGTGVSITNGAGAVTIAATNNGTVTSVGGTGTVNGLTLTGTVTSTGNLTLGGTLAIAATQVTSGTLAVARGGTGVTTSTGTGATVRDTSPTLVTPVLGTPTSGNLSNCTADGTDAVGFRNIPQNSRSAAYTLVLADAGKHIFHPAADATNRTFTIPANSSVAFPVGTAITFINQDGTGGIVTIAITTDTMRLAGPGTTGSRTLARNGVATAVKITSTEWIISGTGLT